MDRCDSVPTLSGTLPPCRTGFRTFTRWVPTTTQKLFTYRYFPRPGPSQERLTKQPKRPGTRPSPLPSLIPPLLPEGEGAARCASRAGSLWGQKQNQGSKEFTVSYSSRRMSGTRIRSRGMIARRCSCARRVALRSVSIRPSCGRISSIRCHTGLFTNRFRSGVRVVGTDDFDLAVQGTQRGDLGQVGHPAQNQMLPAPGATLGKNPVAGIARLAVKGEE